MSKRSLTGGEIALAREVYRDSIDYAAVSVYDERFAFFLRSDMAYTNIYLPRRYHPDFSQAPVFRQRLFIHEMMHIWQYQNNVLNLPWAATVLLLKHPINYEKSYSFLLEAGKDLTDYGMEQQAAIIEEYFLRTRGTTWERCFEEERRAGGAASMKKTIPKRCLNKGSDTQVLLESFVLKKFLEDPSYVRCKELLYPVRPPNNSEARSIYSSLGLPMNDC